MVRKNITNILKEAFVVTILGQGLLLMGLTSTFVAYNQPKVDENIFDEILSGSLSWFCTLIGSLLSIGIIDSYGRKASIQLCSICYSVGGILHYVWTNSTTFYLCRALAGIAIGTYPAFASYISETACENRRGILTTLNIIFYNVGCVLCYTFQYLVSIRIICGITGIIGLATLTGMWFLPETKYWYITKYKYAEALESALWFNNNVELAKNELHEIQSRIGVAENADLLSILADAKNLKQFCVSTLLIICCVGTGRVPVGVYIKWFFAQFRLEFDGVTLTLALIYLESVFSIIVLFVIDRFERKKLLNVTIWILMLPLTTLIIIYTFFQSMVNVFLVNTLIIVCIFVYVISTMAFLYPLLAVLSSELISSTHSKRGSILNLGHVINYAFIGIYTASFPYLLYLNNVVIILLIFTFFIAIIVVLTRLFVLETVGKPLYKCVEI